MALKIWYSYGKLSGSSNRAKLFQKHYGAHNVIFSGYADSKFQPQFLLSAVDQNPQAKESLFKALALQQPDLAVIDYDPRSNQLAEDLGIPVINCSPIHAFQALTWPARSISICPNNVEILRHFIPDQASMYFPALNLPLKHQYTWVHPWTMISPAQGDQAVACVPKERKKDLQPILNGLNFPVQLFTKPNKAFLDALRQSKWLLTGGDTEVVALGIQAQVKTVVAPVALDLEAICNAAVVQRAGLGQNVDQVELLGPYAVSVLEKSFHQDFQFPEVVQSDITTLKDILYV